MLLWAPDYCLKNCGKLSFNVEEVGELKTVQNKEVTTEHFREVCYFYYKTAYNGYTEEMCLKYDKFIMSICLV